MFDKNLRPEFLKLINLNKENKEESDNLFGLIDNEDFKKDIKLNEITQFKEFSQILELEEEFILDKIELDKGIGNSRSLKENLFLLFVSLGTIIPLIIIGKPGSGKSLSAHLIYKSMKGKYSKNKFFESYPSIIQSYFQGSKSATPDDVSNIFKIAEDKLKPFLDKKEECPVSMLLFDELGLAERSIYNPLKVLHNKLDEYFNEHMNLYDNNKQKVDFIGITNWNLDAAKLNRALSLSVPDLDEDIDDLRETSITIANSYNSNFAEKKRSSNDSKNENKNEFDNEDDVQIFEELLPKVYSKYKETLKYLKKLTAKNIYKKEYKKDKPLTEIETEKEFKIILSKEKKIKVDFHGNRDFFNLIKGVARELSETNEIEDSKSVVNLIEKYIERNFGGMEIEIDIDQKDIEDGQKYLGNIKELKKKNITSVKFFKCIYNTFVEEKSEKIEKYRNYNIKEIDDYKIIKCIDDNVKDEYSRYLLLGIKPSLGILINQNIEKKMKMVKNVFLMEGSPFVNDENMEYQYRVINDIQEHAKNENGHILFLQNLNSIYPFLYDLFNMNYLIKDGKSYARICHGNYSDQLALINKKFRIVIMVDKKYIDKLESPFLNRFEKILIKFNELLNDSQKKFTEELLKGDFNFRDKINQIDEENKCNYSLKDLLIGCKDEDIQGLVYDFSKDIEIDENNKESIKSNVMKKIVKLLPQDIIINLPEGDEIKKQYFNHKKFYDINEYLEVKDITYKISIIYTFNNITENISVLDTYGESIMISDIKSEKELKKQIINIISSYKKSSKLKKKFIILRFVQSNSQNLNFVVHFLKNNFEEEPFYFICIVHIKRYFINKENKDRPEKIFNIPNLYINVDQLFIDNLKKLDEDDDNCQKLNLKDILENPVNDLLKNVNLEKDFDKTLHSFINKYLSNNTRLLKGEDDNINQSNYLIKLEEYFKNDSNFKDQIINKAKDIITLDGKSLIKEIYKNNGIKKTSIDIISIMLDYIREGLVSQYIMDILENLEDKNFITSLLVLESKKESKILDEEKINDIKNLIMDNLVYKEKSNYDVKFDLNYTIPGFYNIIRELSNIVSKSYSASFMKNEKKLRDFLKGNKDDAVTNYYDIESELIEQLYIELQNDKNKKIFNMMKSIKIPKDTFFSDYITFYLDKYYSSNIDMNSTNYFKNSCYLSMDYVNHKVIKLLLQLRFKEDKKPDDENDENDEEYIKSILKKICWLESNINYIIDILEIYTTLKENFEKKDNDEKLFEIINSNYNNIHYITNEEKNPEITTLVNECYYLILASIIYGVIPPNIDFTKMKGIQLTYYIDSLKTTSKILGELNDNLKIFLNEMYIIDEFIIIYETLDCNNKIDLNLLNTFSETLRENSLIIQKNEANYSEELINNYKELYKLITENLTYTDKNYHSLLKYIFFKEIKKLKDIDYRTAIFDDLIKEKEVIKTCNNVFQILLKDLIKTSRDSFIKTIDNLLKDKSEIVQIIENTLDSPKENNYLALMETLLYFFEKNSLIYLNKILNEFIIKDKKKQNFE